MTIVVDVANVMGSRPDGWWRDRAGAAVRLHVQIARLAASGRAILPGGNHPPGEQPSSPGEDFGSLVGPGENAPAFVLVLEGAARAAVSRLPSARSSVFDAEVGPAASEVGPAASDAAPAASDAAATSSAPDGLARAGPVQPGEVRVVEARGSGDDAIVAVVRELPGRRVVVTADRELRGRCAEAGAEILGPSWLLGLLRD